MVILAVTREQIYKILKRIADEVSRPAVVTLKRDSTNIDLSSTNSTLSSILSQLQSILTELTSISAEDFATETTLSTIDTRLVSGGFTAGASLETIKNKDFATETTLAGIDFATQTTLAIVSATLATISATLSSMSSKLSTIDSNTDGIEGTLSSIDGNTDDINNLLNPVHLALMAELQAINSNTDPDPVSSKTIAELLKTIDTNTDGIETKLNDVNSKLDTLNTSVDNIEADVDDIFQSGGNYTFSLTNGDTTDSFAPSGFCEAQAWEASSSDATLRTVTVKVGDVEICSFTINSASSPIHMEDMCAELQFIKFNSTVGLTVSADGVTASKQIDVKVCYVNLRNS